MRIFRILVCVAVFFCSWVARAQAASISGKVTSQNGQLIPNAKITGYTLVSGNPDSLIFQAFSDTNGKYSLNGLVNGKYRLFCEHPGYLTAFRSITVTNDSNLVGIDFQLSAGTGGNENLIAGLVLNSQTQAPIANATVYLWTKTGEDSITTAIFSVQSDTAGRYEFRSFRPLGKYVLLAEASGYQPFESRDTLTVTDTTRIENLNIFLDPFENEQATLMGRVLDSKGYTTNQIFPIAGAEIRLVGFRDGGDSLHYRATTDAQGNFIITNIPPGIGQALITASGYYDNVINPLVLPSGTTAHDFYLAEIAHTPSGLIAGKVFFDKDGAPVEGAIIVPVAVEGGPYNATTRTDAAGRYSVQVPVGKYAVSCQIASPDSLSFGLLIYAEYYDNVLTFAEATIITVTENQTTGNIDFGIPELTSRPKTVIIRGKVLTEDGTPLENARVTARSLANPDSLEVSTLSNGTGEYTITMANKTNWRNAIAVFYVEASKAGYAVEYYNNRPALFLADPIYVFSDTTIDNIDFSLSPNSSSLSIRGTITNEMGTPLRSAFVVGANMGTGEIVFTFTDAQGNYALENLKPFNHTVLFAADGYVPEFFDNVSLWEQATPLFPASPLATINAQLTPIAADSGSGAVAGKVVDQHHSPLAGVLITTRNALGKTVGFDLTDGSGAYQIKGVGSGRYTIQATKARFKSEAGEILNTPDGGGMQIVNFTLTQITTGIKASEASEVLPQEFELSDNYPNPFSISGTFGNPATTIAFALPQAQQVRLVIYDILGHEVRELLNRRMEAGRHHVQWNGTDNAGRQVASGIYLYLLKTGQTKLVRKIVLSK